LNFFAISTRLKGKVKQRYLSVFVAKNLFFLFFSSHFQQGINKGLLIIFSITVDNGVENCF